MSGPTIIWSILIGACATIAFPYLLVGIWQRRAADLFFVGVAVGTIGLAAGELGMMHAISAEQYGVMQRWLAPPVFLLMISTVGFVLLYFGAGRLWLGITTCFLRFVCLIRNFVSPVNLTFTKMTGLVHVPFLGERVSVGAGVLSPWAHLGELTSLFMVAFVTDASVSLWRKGKERDRRRAITVGGSIVLAYLIAQAVVVLFRQGVTSSPYPVGLWFFVIVAAMALELSYDTVRVAVLARQLQASDAALFESEGRFRRVADSAPVMMWMAGVNKLCTFFNKPWLEFTGRTIQQEIGMGWAEGVHPDDLQGCLTTYTEAFDARNSFVMQYRLRRHDGQYCWIRDDGVPRYDAEGNFAGYIGSCVDITELISNEQALRESEERRRVALDAAQVGLWDWNFAKDELWGTKARRAQLGLPLSGKIKLEEVLSRVHADDRDRVRKVLMDAARTGKDYSCEYRIKFADGTEHWTELRGHYVKSADGEPVLRTVTIDLTERRQAEQKFRLAVEASPSGILLVDHQGRIVLVNAHIEELFGYTRDELIGKPIEIFVPERFVKAHPAMWKKYFDAPERRMLGHGRELFARRKDGTEFPVEIGLNPIQGPNGLLALATVVDITDRKQAEEKFRLALEASPSGIVLVNREGSMTLVNTQTERMFGYDRNELIGKPVEMLVPERFRTGHPAYRAKFFAAPQTRPMGAGGELFARRKDGSEFRVEIGLNPIHTAQGLVILADIVDISARLAAEEQGRRNREQVELLGRVSLLGEMTASLAHELNQPLAAIVNNAAAITQYLKQGRLNPQRLEDILGDVVADGRRAFDIVQNVRNAIKKGSAIRGRINLNDVVKTVTRMVHADAAANLCKMETSLAPDLPAIEGDPTQIQQVLINVLHNAFDAMRNTKASRRIVEIATTCDGDGTISLDVRDYGSGISEPTRERLFEHFFTTKEEGLGMGLPIVHSIIKAHGGSIAVENAEGGGARFHFRLPIKEDMPQ